MAEHVPRLRFSLDLLMAEAKRRARQRRFIVGTLAIIIVAAAMGLTLGLRGPSGGPTTGLSAARFPIYRLSLRYPAAWSRLDCRWISTASKTITFMSTARLRSACSKYRNGLFIPERLGQNGVLVQWVEVDLPGWGRVIKPNARIGGQPARIAAISARSPSERASCGAIGGQRVLKALIQDPALKGATLSMFACFSGPDLGATSRAVNKLLASVRFTQ